MSWVSLFIRVGVPLLVAIGFAFSAIDYGKKRAEVADSRACTAAAGDAEKPLTRCSAPLRAAIDTKRRADACEAALQLPRDRGLFAIRASCPAGVKRLVASEMALIVDLASARRELAQAETATKAAVERAEARADDYQRKVQDNAKRIDAAPRGADGRIRCDADCLRGLTK